MKAGGPTVHTRQTLPDWDGYYQRRGNEDQWIWGVNLQTATMLSLLTPSLLLLSLLICRNLPQFSLLYIREYREHQEPLALESNQALL
mgnify:CR=1 FL=1